MGLLKSHLVDLQQEQWLGAVDSARACGVDLVTFVGMELASPYGYEAQSNAIYDLVDPDRLDGLIIWTPTIDPFTGPGRIEELFRRFGPGPRVSVEHAFPGIPSVLMDDRGGMYGIVSHLIESHGLRRIAFLRGPEAHAGAELRLQGYLDALGDHGLPYDPALVAPSPPYWRPDRVQPWIEALFEGGRNDIQGIAAANDFLALAVLTSLADLGVIVPRDVAVTGYDDLIDVKRPDVGLPYWGGVESSHVMERIFNQVATTMPLTTARAPFNDLGRQAVELVVAQLRGESIPDVVRIDTQLRIRRSCGCLSHEIQDLGSVGPAKGRRSPRAVRASGRPSARFRERLDPARARIAADLQGRWAKRGRCRPIGRTA